MENVACLQWLRLQQLYDVSEKIVPVAKKVLTSCLGIVTEKILIIGDTGTTDRHLSSVLSGAYYLAAQELRLHAKLVFQEMKPRGSKAENQVLDSLKSLEKGSVIILNMSDKLGSIGELGKSFRRWSKKQNHRFISAMSLKDLTTENYGVITNAIDISYRPLRTRMQTVKKLFDSGNEIRVTTPAGTDLTYTIKDIEAICVDGDYLKPGSGGNLPAGEVYIAPHGKKVNGRVVIDGSCKTHEGTILVKNPTELIIEDGSIVSIADTEEGKALQRTLTWAASVSKNPGGIRRICEFGLGFNQQAKITGAMIVDDKSLGSAHIGIGSNYWFGGTIYALIHLDQVFRNPTVYVDGKKITI